MAWYGLQTEIVTSEPQVDHAPTIESTLRDHGLNPDDWDIGHCTINTWESSALVENEWQVHLNHQMKVSVRPKLENVFPSLATAHEPYVPREIPGESDVPSQMVVVLSDVQEPWGEPKLREKACDFIRFMAPNYLVYLGDIIDLPSVGRHQRNPKSEASLNECLDAGRSFLTDTMHAASLSDQFKQAFFLPGNHELHLHNYMMRQAQELYDLHDSSGNYVLGIDHLLGLRDLGITYIDGETSDYPQPSLVIPPGLVSYRHGWIIKSQAGASGLATAVSLGQSVTIGHTHRQGVARQTFEDLASGNQRVIYAMETGTMAKWRGGLGYCVAPNWQQGFGVVYMYPDGHVWMANAEYENGNLYFGGYVF